MALLQSYTWPGNVRELQNIIERAVVLSSGAEISEADFPAEIRRAVGTVSTMSESSEIDDALPLNEAVQAFKRLRVLRALATAQGNQRQAATLLGIQPSNLSRLMSTLGLR